MSGSPLTVTGDATFSVDVTATGGNALYLSSGSGITFTDNTGGALAGGALPTSANGDAIHAKQIAGSGDLTISTGSSVALSGGNYAIYVLNGGTGTLSITRLGTVLSSHQGGIRGFNSAGLGGETISVVTATGYNAGINAINEAGALSVSATGLVSATGTSGVGITAFNNAPGTNLTITAVDVTGGGTGLEATNDGTGFLKITATGTVTGSKGDGVDLANSGSYAKINLAKVHALAGFRGIQAFDTGGDMTISAGAVSALDEGFYGKNTGTGALSFTATGAVTTTGTGQTAIIATNAAFSPGKIAKPPHSRLPQREP